MIHSCFLEREPIYPTLTSGYRKEYYLLHRNTLLLKQKNYNERHKKRIQYYKSLWFQRHKNRLRKKHGFVRKNITKPKDIINTEIIKKNITLTFD